MSGDGTRSRAARPVRVIAGVVLGLGALGGIGGAALGGLGAAVAGIEHSDGHRVEHGWHHHDDDPSPPGSTPGR